MSEKDKCPKCGKNAVGTILDGMCGWCWRDHWERKYHELSRDLAEAKAGPEWSAFEHELERRLGAAREAIRLEYAGMVCKAHEVRDAGDAENERLRKLLGHIDRISTGEDQVADDDTEAMGVIHDWCEAAEQAQQSQQAGEPK